MLWRLTFLLVVLALAASGCDRDRALAALESSAAVGGASSTRPAVTPASPAADAGTGGREESIGGVSVTPLQWGDLIDLPDDIAVIVETGCWQCDGPTAGFVRVYRDRRGELRTDTLIARTEGAGNTPYISGFAVAPDASEMVVAICSRGYCGALNAVTEDARTTLLRSGDGGVMWQELETLDGAYDVVALVDDGTIVYGPFAPRDRQPGNPAYMVVPGERPLMPPQGAERPVPLPDGEVLWQSADGRRLLRGDGSVYLAVPLGGEARYVRISPQGESGHFVVQWWSGPGGQPPRAYLGIVRRGGDVLTAYALPHGTDGSGVWLNDTMTVGIADVPADRLGGNAPRSPGLYRLPVLVDLAAGRVAPIAHPFVDGPLRNGRNHVVAAMPGPFARVVEAGDCLNVRAAPETTAAALACMADGVLLRDMGETRESGGMTWLRVVTPAGIDGWASIAYLER